MTSSFPISSRAALLASVWALALGSLAAEPAWLVMQNGRSIPLSAVVAQGDQFVVQTAVEPFTAGQSIPMSSVDHVYGDKPAGVNQAIALMLTGKRIDAIRLLEPIVNLHRPTAKIPGNFWIEAARALAIARALGGDAKEIADLGREISDATPAQGTDPVVMLAKALAMPVSAKLEDRDVALRNLASGTQPAEIAAYASYFRGKLFLDEKKPTEALEAYLSVGCLFPSGNMVVTAAAELQAFELMPKEKERINEALAVLKSAARGGQGTLIAQEANKRLETVK